MIMTIGIKYFSYADRGGYGTAATAYLNGLLRAGMPLTWKPFVFGKHRYVPWDPGQGTLPIEEDHRQNIEADPAANLSGVIGKQLEYDTVLMHTQPQYWPDYWEEGKRRIGYTVWETDHIPRHWKALLNTAEQIFVPCRFNVDVFQSNGVSSPISVIPHIYRIPDEAGCEEIAAFRKQLDIRDDQFIFYTINAWTARKAMWQTITAYLDTFTASDPVVLVIKTDHAGVRNEDGTTIVPTPQMIAELCAGRRQVPEIRLICRSLSLREMDLLHQVGDAYLSLTHSEGWGLGAFEAAGIGNPVIITGWGGHLDYLLPGYFGLVNYRLIPVRDRLGLRPNEIPQNWAEAQQEHAVHLMHEVVRKPADLLSISRKVRDHIRTRFSESFITDRLLKTIYEPHTP